MKIISILIVLIPLTTFAQLHTGVTSSLQVNSLTGDDVPDDAEYGSPSYTADIAFDIGLAAHYDVTTNVRLISGVNYKSKGFALEGEGSSRDEDDYTYDSHFTSRSLSLPLYIQGSFGSKESFAFINAGVEFDYLLSVEAQMYTKINDFIIDTVLTTTEGVQEFDIALGCNVGYQFDLSAVDLFVSVGYQLGLMPTVKEEDGVKPGDVHYQSVRLNVGVLFTVLD